MLNVVQNNDPWNIIANLSPTSTTICYFVLIFVVIFLSILLSQLCVILKKKTKFSEAVIGSILLGVTTSFPELITSITSLFCPPHNGFIAIGDIIGSNLFDLFALAIFLICFLIAKKTKLLDKSNFISIICMLINAIFCFLCGVFYKYVELGSFNIFTIIFLCIFIFNTVWFIKEHNKNKKQIKIIKQNNDVTSTFFSKWPLWLIVFAIILSALLLIIASCFLTFFAMQINTYLQLDDTFGGAILLGIITSLPEIITCLALAIGGHYNMLIGDIVGSINFNFLILFITNIVLSCTYQSQMFSFFYDPKNITTISIQILFFLAQSIFIFLYAISNTKKSSNRKLNVISKWHKYLTLTVVTSCYLCFLIMGCLKIGL